MPVEFLGIIEHTMELGISYYRFRYTSVLLQVSRYENWELGCCNMQDFSSSFYNSIVYSHSSHLEVIFVQDRPFWFHHLFPPNDQHSKQAVAIFICACTLRYYWQIATW